MERIYTNDDIVQVVGAGGTPPPMGKPSLMIGVPCTDVFYKPFVMSLSKSLIRLPYKMSVTMVGSCYVHRNRNQILAHAKEKDVDYLLMVDSDSVWQPNDVVSLMDFDKPVACGWYLSRNIVAGKDVRPVIMQFKDGKYWFLEKVPIQPFLCDAIGCGFMLLKREVIDKMLETGKPFDMLQASEVGNDGGLYTNLVGEDLSFCYRLQKAGFEIWVDPNIHIGHASVNVIM